MFTFFRKAFPVKKHRIVQGIAYGALLCAVNLLTPLLESTEIPIWGPGCCFYFGSVWRLAFLWQVNYS